MADVLFVVLILAFFGLATLLVRACDRIIGPDPVLSAVEDVRAAGQIDPVELVA